MQQACKKTGGTARFSRSQKGLCSSRMSKTRRLSRPIPSCLKDLVPILWARRVVNQFKSTQRLRELLSAFKLDDAVLLQLHQDFQTHFGRCWYPFGGVSTKFCLALTFDLWNIPSAISAIAICSEIRPRTPTHHVWPSWILIFGGSWEEPVGRCSPSYTVQNLGHSARSVLKGSMDSQTKLGRSGILAAWFHL